MKTAPLKFTKVIAIYGLNNGVRPGTSCTAILPFLSQFDPFPAMCRTSWNEVLQRGMFHLSTEFFLDKQQEEFFKYLLLSLYHLDVTILKLMKLSLSKKVPIVRSQEENKTHLETFPARTMHY
jgi:hypothetical protein